MIVVVDNRDSFVFNLTRHFQLLGVETVVVPSHGTTAAAILAVSPAAIVISPGPCTPAEAGCSLELVRAARGRVPLLGVCLGHQAIAAAVGGRVVRATSPVHGRTSEVLHDGVNLFSGIPSPMTACRYHSLVVDAGSLPPGIAAIARDRDGTADFNLLIRTLVVSPGSIAFAAGGGITAASEPSAEHAESLHKAEGMLRVLDACGIGEGG